MAKIKVRPHPGALSKLLKKKGMTQMDAFEKTRVDRKTLSKIDRGEEVKLETLQQVINKLQVTEEYFRDPPAAEVTVDGDDPEPGTIMLRKLDASRLEELLGGAERVKWLLNAKVRDDEVRNFLEDFETAIENSRRQHVLTSRETETLSLRLQLDRFKTADDIASGLACLAEHRLALLGASHLFWECSYEDHGYEDIKWFKEEYRSSKTILLSVDPFGTRSRRVRFSYGNPPPMFAPDLETAVFVDGERLLSPEEL
jgi:transcriptional regulator with XRE-family HTH domain